MDILITPCYAYATGAAASFASFASHGDRLLRVHPVILHIELGLANRLAPSVELPGESDQLVILEDAGLDPGDINCSSDLVESSSDQRETERSQLGDTMKTSGPT